MEISRNKIYEYSLQSLTSFLICVDSDVEIYVENTIENITGVSYNDAPLLLKQIIIYSLKNLKEIISKIEPFLNKWKFERLNYCIRSILILSYTNFYYVKDVEKAIVIDCAIKLAKKYGDSEDYKFINAVLDKCLTNEK